MSPRAAALRRALWALAGVTMPIWLDMLLLRIWQFLADRTVRRR
ncbi:hypothetical protein [Nocardia sp. NPDC055049]